MVDKKEVASVGAKPSSKPVLLAYNPKLQPLIVVKGISKGFKSKLVLKDVSFDVFSGDIFGLIGMSGSGKTTLFQLMAGIISPDSGDVLVKRELLLPKGKDGLDYLSVFKNPALVKRNFGFASQMPSFYEHLTVEENLHLYGSLYSMPEKAIKESASRLMRLVQLTEEKDTIASELSGGMQRRLDIACALIHEPKILFLDEPTSDLDPIMRKQVWSVIKDISVKGTTIVLASHILEEVENICNKVAILHDRHILGYGTLKELKELFKRGKQIRIEFDKPDYDRLVKRLKSEKGIDRILQKEGKLVILVNKEEAALKKIVKIVESSKERSPSSLRWRTRTSAC
ncbi:ABC transporter ATP-binding protein [archaeon]|nr:ABC transporter ATP-binding protein [archaeon]